VFIGVLRQDGVIVWRSQHVRNKHGRALDDAEVAALPTRQ
jgi:hypothetical protein